MASPDRPSAGAQAGATPVGGKPRRRPGWIIPLLLIIAAVIVASLLLSRCGGDDSASSAGAGTSSSTRDAGGSSAAPSSTASVSPGTGAEAPGASGTVTAGGQSVLDLAGSPNPATALAAVTGQPATASGARVLSVPADEGFWVGSLDAERVWVQLTGGGESPYQVKAGDVLNFQGTVVAHGAGFASQVGVAVADGAAQLDAQGQHLEVAKSAISLAG